MSTAPGGTQPPAPASPVRSADGTTIAYRQAGDGPGVVLLHGSGQSSDLLSLARTLSGTFTVYLPERRGRGGSGPYTGGHSLQEEIEDLTALLDRTHAHNVFGHSVGAVIAIEAARTIPGITKLALYEPPLEFDGITHTAWLPRYEREMASGRLADALVTIMKGTADRTAVRLVPRFLLATALGLAIRRAKDRPVPAGVTHPRDIISAMHNDARTVLDAAGPLDRFAGLPCEVLLLGGSRSARNLTAPLDGLSAMLPRADRVTLPRAGHTAPSNNGKPQLVAAHLRAFFS